MENKLRITGASDDLILINGDPINSELYLKSDRNGDYLVFNDGTIVHIGYAINNTSTWDISIVKRGTAKTTLLGWTDEDKNFSDILTLVGPITKVFHFENKDDALEFREALNNKSKLLATSELINIIDKLASFLNDMENDYGGYSVDVKKALLRAELAVSTARSV